MKKACVLMFAVAAAATLNAATINQVIVRQQWPWSIKIKVEYRLSGVDASHPVDIAVTTYNGDDPLPSTNLRAAIEGNLYGITEEFGEFYIDPVVAYGTEKIGMTKFKVKLAVTDSADNINEVLYKIVDLTPPYAVTDVTRKDFYNGKYGAYVTTFADIDSEFSTSLESVLIWTDVTNDVYKTSKMVFRRIPAAGQSYMFQTNNASVNGGAGVEVSFARDFYIGVFEVTQSQATNVYQGMINRSYETNALYRATRPLDGQYFDTTLRGKSNWPEDTSHDLVTSGTTASLLYQMQSKIGLLFDLPTEAMWEYACRAGTTTPLYTGAPSHSAAWDDGHCRKIMRAYGCNVTAFPSGWTDAEKKGCNLSYGPNIVGGYKPNAWGLYDMLGNVREWCLDRNIAATSLASVTYGEDPVGPTTEQGGSSVEGVMRGGSYADNAINCHGRHSGRRTYNTNYFGVRLCIYLTNHADGTK